MNWLRVAAVPFRAQNADLSTPHGRSSERLRRIGLSTAASVVARGIAFATSFISVPLTLHYLGAERYGMWATLSSVVAFAGFADLGLGNGLLNALSASHGRDDRAAAARQASTAFVVLSGVAVSLGIAFALVYGRVDWAELYNVTSPLARREAGPATAALVTCFLVGLPVGLVARIRQGYQEAYKTGLFDIGGSLLGLVAVLLAISLRAPIVWLVIALAGVPILSMVVHAAVLFGRDRPWLRVRLTTFESATATRLLQHGLLFFALQVAGALMYAPDNLIVAQLRGPEAVASYSVAVKLFSVSILLAEVALVPLWPAFGEAIARGDHAWVRQTLRRSLQLTTLAATLLAVVLVVAGNWFISLWVGSAMVANRPLLLGLGAWAVIGTVGTAAAMYLNAANRVGVQVACAIAMIPASLALKVVMVERYGPAGAPWALVLAYLAFVAAPLVVLAGRGRLGPPRTHPHRAEGEPEGELSASGSGLRGDERPD